MSTLADVIIRDTLANRPAASIEGRLFYDTTNSILYRDSGAAWESVEGSGGGGGGGGASILGKTTTGASSELMVNQQEYAKKITIPSAGTIISVGARIQQSAASNSTHGMAAAVWNDNSGVIGLLAGLGAPYAMYLQTDGAGTLPWHKIWRPVGAHFDGGADIWIGIMLQSGGSVAPNISYDTGGTDRTVTVSQPYVTTGGTVFTQTTTTKAYDIFATFLPD